MLSKLLISHIILIRPLNVLISGFSVFIASESLYKEENDSTLFFLIAGIVMLFTAGSNVLNDYVDYKIDIINKPFKPISRGYVKRFCFLFSYVFEILGCLLCMKLNDRAEFIGIFIAMPIMVLYTSYLKKLPLVGNVAVAFTLSLSFLFCGSAYGNTTPNDCSYDIVLFSFILRELIKDISDIKRG